MFVFLFAFINFTVLLLMMRFILCVSNNDVGLHNNAALIDVYASIGLDQCCSWRFRVVENTGWYNKK